MKRKRGFYVLISKMVYPHEVVKEMGPCKTERAAEKIARGVSINLDNDNYSVRVTFLEGGA